MNNLLKYLMLSLLPCLFACEQDESLSSIDTNDTATITIAASIDNGKADTRMAYDNSENIPSVGKPFGPVAIWASTETKTYADGADNGSDENTVSMHITETFTSGTKLINNDTDQGGIVYPYQRGRITNPTVYFTGFYPETAWTTSNWTQQWSVTDSNHKANFNFDGTHDVMYAPQVEGVFAGVVPELHFYHLLTFLRFKLQAENEEASIAWGKITDIKLSKQYNSGKVSPYSEVTINLNPDIVPVTLSDIENITTFSSNVSSLSLYSTDTDDVFPGSNGYSLITTASEVAYVICAPVNASSSTTDYTLTITTEYRGAITLDIDLKSGVNSAAEGSTMGQMFTVNLVFRLDNNIAVATTVGSWITGGVGSKHIEEN